LHGSAPIEDEAEIDWGAGVTFGTFGVEIDLDDNIPWAMIVDDLAFWGDAKGEVGGGGGDDLTGWKASEEDE